MRAPNGRVGVGRRSIRIRGVVQGVGFRPAMFRLAEALALTGFVHNDREGVVIEIEGSLEAIDRFLADVRGAAPPASRIEHIAVTECAPAGDRSFRIAESPRDGSTRQASAAIPADLGPCVDCLSELTDAKDRRHRYPFINCTSCGPRFTIVREIPYDRPKTTMAAFTMCSACRREYETPSDRRFHAEPNGCADCGPRVQLVAGRRVLLEGDAAVRAAACALTDDRIVAVKGVGGFVLAVDACSEAAVARLRVHKRRLHKAFAVMVRTVADAAAFATVDEHAKQLLESPARPIVLVPARGELLAPSVAPGLSDVGVYLPPTPLQYLLLCDGPHIQVMTSGNVTDEPIARTNEEAFERLAGIADLLLVHNRDVHARADDSVVRSSHRHPIPMRRARGFVPAAIHVADAGIPVLAVGGHERNTVCLAHGGDAVLSQHVGDLDHPDAEAFFREAIQHLQELVGVAPQMVVHDRHPDYQSTRWAVASGLPRVEVQHHHAHVAACLAEHGRTDRVVGVAFDGTGLGDDGTLWGGEILDADLGSSRRLGHLRPLALAGGEAAIREPWRIGAAALLDAGEDLDVLRVDAADRARVTALLATSLPARATGAGRWFDAVAALLGVARNVSYDGQAAAQLEALAGDVTAQPLELAISRGDPFEIDLRPAIRELARELRRDAQPALLAARFHMTMALAIRLSCRHANARTVVLSGGCFQNRRLLEAATGWLEADGIEVLSHRRVPPNDGGLALGQVAIVAHQLASGRLPCV